MGKSEILESRIVYNSHIKQTKYKTEDGVRQCRIQIND